MSKSTASFGGWKVGERYDLHKILGKGSYGQVAQATDRKTGAKVAIKFMEDIFHQTTDAKRAYREMHILRHLRHSTIIGLVDAVAPNIIESMSLPATEHKEVLNNKRRLRELGDLYLVFDYMDTDLSKIFKSDQNMLIGHVQFILHQLLLGLKHIHSANVIHRDIKPANILVSCADCGIKIADFGLSRVVRPEEIGDIGVTAPEEEMVVDGNLPTPPSAQRSVPEQQPHMPPILPTRTSSNLDLVAHGEQHDNLGPALGPALTGSQADGAGKAKSVTISGGAAVSGSASGFGTIEKTSLRRQLTHHVVTRWYRAPEVILSEPYNAAVDVWSIGCIFAELLGMIKENVRVAKHRRPLFPGESCGELSPTGRRGFDTSFHDGGRDQLNVIFEVMGTPSEEDLLKINYDTAVDLRAFRRREPENLQERFPASDETALSLLRAMLTFDPAKRITAAQALRHPFLAAFNTEEKESQAVCTNPMSSDIESVCEDPEHLFYSIVGEIRSYSDISFSRESSGSSTEMDT